jgi:hypothetical protein
MERAHLLFTVLPLLFMPPAFGREPELNVKAICNARSDDAKTMGSTPDPCVAECVRDEEATKQGLNTLWALTSVPIQNQCASDARALGTTSYLDLLACLQMTEDVKSNPKKGTEK